MKFNNQRQTSVHNRERVVEELAMPMVHKLIQEFEDGFHLSPTLESFPFYTTFVCQTILENFKIIIV